MRFSDITGHSETKTVLINAVKNNHVAHAQLFFGKEGSANLTLALAYAAYLNCENPTETDSCGSCPSCIKIDKLVHPDFHFVFPKTAKQASDDESAAKGDTMTLWRSFLLENPYGNAVDWAELSGSAGKQLNISKDDGKHIIKTVSMKAFEAKYKVLLIWLPEFMNISAANSILKVLEEPPEKTVYLMVTNDYEKLITTIISRTQLIRVPDFQVEDIQQYLVEKQQIDSEKAQKLALMSDGSLRVAMNWEHHSEEDSHQIFREWMRECWGLDILNLHSKSYKFNELNKATQKSMLVYGLAILRECLATSMTGNEPNRPDGEEKTFVENFADNVPTEKYEKLSSILTEAHFHLERNGNPRIVFMDTSMQISGVLRSK